MSIPSTSEEITFTAASKIQEARIFVEHGDVTDFLFCEEVVPYRTGSRYACRLCDKPAYYGSLEALWIKHLFEPAFAFVEEKLLRAEGIGFFKRDDATWAKLGRSSDLAAEGATWIRPISSRPDKVASGARAGS